MYSGGKQKSRSKVVLTNGEESHPEHDVSSTMKNGIATAERCINAEKRLKQFLFLLGLILWKLQTLKMNDSDMLMIINQPIKKSEK